MRRHSFVFLMLLECSGSLEPRNFGGVRPRCSSRWHQPRLIQRHVFESHEAVAVTTVNQDDLSEYIHYMATFLAVRMGRTWLRSMMHKKALRPPIVKVRPDAETTQHELHAAERPSTLHKREGDRSVGLSDAFLDAEDIDDVELVAFSVPDSGRKEAEGVETVDDTVKVLVEPRLVAAQGTLAPVIPDVVSSAFGRPLEVLQSPVPALRQEIMEQPVEAASLGGTTDSPQRDIESEEIKSAIVSGEDFALFSDSTDTTAIETPVERPDNNSSPVQTPRFVMLDHEDSPLDVSTATKSEGSGIARKNDSTNAVLGPEFIMLTEEDVSHVSVARGTEATDNATKDDSPNDVHGPGFVMLAHENVLGVAENQTVSKSGGESVAGSEDLNSNQDPVVENSFKEESDTLQGSGFVMVSKTDQSENQVVSGEGVGVSFQQNDPNIAATGEVDVSQVADFATTQGVGFTLLRAPHGVSSEEDDTTGSEVISGAGFTLIQDPKAHGDIDLFENDSIGARESLDETKPTGRTQTGEESYSMIGGASPVSQPTSVIDAVIETAMSESGPLESRSPGVTSQDASFVYETIPRRKDAAPTTSWSPFQKSETTKLSSKGSLGESASAEKAEVEDVSFSLNKTSSRRWSAATGDWSPVESKSEPPMARSKTPDAATLPTGWKPIGTAKSLQGSGASDLNTQIGVPSPSVEIMERDLARVAFTSTLHYERSQTAEPFSESFYSSPIVESQASEATKQPIQRPVPWATIPSFPEVPGWQDRLNWLGIKWRPDTDFSSGPQDSKPKYPGPWATIPSLPDSLNGQGRLNWMGIKWVHAGNFTRV